MSNIEDEDVALFKKIGARIKTKSEKIALGLSFHDDPFFMDMSHEDLTFYSNTLEKISRVYNGYMASGMYNLAEEVLNKYGIEHE